MKHEHYFDDFLKESVNLNQSRLDTLEDRVSTITDFLKRKVPGCRVSKQGSYAHQTIIKPVQGNDEFDADLLLLIRDPDFRASNFGRDYVKEIYDIFRDNDTYKPIVRLKTRCATLDYAGDFGLDIVPCVEAEGDFYICNRDDRRYEKTDGEGYRQWLSDQNSAVGGNYLRKSVRLFKFLRDHKDNFSVKSILLTTLLGRAVENGGAFSDLPTTLKTLSSGVNNFLEQNPDMPIVRNPVLPAEDFNRHWDENKYANFRVKFFLYNAKINDAYGEQEHNASVRKWRKLFGDNFGKLKDDDTGGAALSGTGIGISAVGTVAARKPYGGIFDD